MGEWSANNQDRAIAVWARLLGFFGDALIRKFDAEPPPEWVELIGQLNDFQIQRGFRRLSHSWKGGPPNLPDFGRYCRAIGDDAPSEGPSQRVALPALATLPAGQFDGWDISANVRFHKYITHRLTENYRPWGPAWTPGHAECTRIAVRYKNAWAQDMRESSTADLSTGEITRPTEEYQASAFADCMRRAETDIAVYQQGKAA
jgi:hypothetical protein